MIDEEVKLTSSGSAGKPGCGDAPSPGQSGRNGEPTQHMHFSAGTKLLFVVTEDWYFVSHRLPLAVAALGAGMDVSIATNVSSTIYNGKGSIRLGLKRNNNSSVSACCGLLKKYCKPMSCTRSRVST